jgi:hypothetical protein
MSAWSHLPKSSGLGKLSKKHKKAFAKSQTAKKAKKPMVKARVDALSAAKRKRAIEGKPTPLAWHIWGSRQTKLAANAVASQLRKQGYKVKVVHADKMYFIHTQGRASRYS